MDAVSKQGGHVTINVDRCSRPEQKATPTTLLYYMSVLSVLFVLNCCCLSGTAVTPCYHRSHVPFEVMETIRELPD